ncbi:hypothetical protein CKM354_000772300 [Cercospora kikuchii]|uniref:Fatty acid desaturase domain-containing protein n=1 Tax=Cercospora kikuchii TaxID=84275 RepID=A0A9P3CNA3_9PEZI|nr:uncharacterized protein CKM354_000772300 [Cercospora kikuchii]GIZ44527.1 hypothetical protein CKM354_000772300 [Cercospora kikuchii]
MTSIDPYLTEPDLILLRNLFEDNARAFRTQAKHTEEQHIDDHKSSSIASGANDSDDSALHRMKALNDPTSPDFEPTVFATWDAKDIHPTFQKYLIQPYINVASNVVRHPTDVIFLTHILLYLSVNVPSAVYLYYNFTYLHGIAHVAFTFWCTGGFTLMMHNHIHNNGVLSKGWAWLDLTFPYILEPLMGHTWDSYYYHHVKHHHVEGNGPEDLSSTIRYQRDNVWHFLHYLGRFLFLIWLDLPLYFLRKNKTKLAAKSFFSEIASMSFMIFMTTKVHFRASIFTLIIPFILLRLGLMIGNWGQHALVDEIEPDSDFRSSITLIDVPSNRFCFNDGYHTAHHLNPRRHWRDQPLHFLQSKKAYAEGRALVFHNIDYLMLTYRLLTKDYAKLAECLVPIGEQIGMSLQEIAAMLKTKTRAFTEEEIREKFGTASSSSCATISKMMKQEKEMKMKPRRKSVAVSWKAAIVNAGALAPSALGLLAFGPSGVEAEVARGHAKAQ